MHLEAFVFAGRTLNSKLYITFKLKLPDNLTLTYHSMNPKFGCD